MKAFLYRYCIQFSLLQLILNVAGTATSDPWNSIVPSTSITQTVPINVNYLSKNMPPEGNTIAQQQGNFVTPGPTVRRPRRKIRSYNDNHSGNRQTVAEWSSSSAVRSMPSSVSPAPIPGIEYPVANSLQTMHNPRQPNFPTASLQGLQNSDHGSVNDFRYLQQPPVPSSVKASAFDLAAFGNGPSQPSGKMDHSPNTQLFSGGDTDMPSADNDENEIDEFTEANEGDDGQEELDNLSALNEKGKWYKENGPRGVSRSREGDLEDKQVGPDDVVAIRRQLEAEIAQKIARSLNHQ